MKLGKLFTVDCVIFPFACFVHVTSSPVNPLLPFLHPRTGMLSLRTRMTPLISLRFAPLNRYTRATTVTSPLFLRPLRPPLLPLLGDTSPIRCLLLLHLTSPHPTPLPPPPNGRPRLRLTPPLPLPSAATHRHSTSAPSASVSQPNPIPPPSIPPGRPLPRYARFVPGISALHPLFLASDQIASVQQAYRSLDHRKLWPVDRLPFYPTTDPAISRALGSPPLFDGPSRTSSTKPIQ